MWKEVADAEKKGLPKTAAAKLQLIYDSAMRDGKHAEAIKALAKRITNEGAVQGNKPEEKITRLQAELEKTSEEAKPLLQTILGHWYWQYFRANRYRFLQRTATAQPLGEDFTKWDLPRLYHEIDLHFANALADGRLKTIPTIDFADLLTKPTLPEKYRPTSLRLYRERGAWLLYIRRIRSIQAGGRLRGASVDDPASRATRQVSRLATAYDRHRVAKDQSHPVVSGRAAVSLG